MYYIKEFDSPERLRIREISFAELLFILNDLIVETYAQSFFDK